MSQRFTYIRSKDGRSKDNMSNDQRSNDKRSKDKRSKSTEGRMTERRIGPNVENYQNFYTIKIFLKFFNSKTTKPILLDSLYTAAGKC